MGPSTPVSRLAYELAFGEAAIRISIPRCPNTGPNPRRSGFCNPADEGPTVDYPRDWGDLRTTVQLTVIGLVPLRRMAETIVA